MRVFQSFFAVVALVLSVCLPSLVLAHATGQSFEQVMGDFKIDVGYDVSSFRAAETVRFDFNLAQELTKEDVAYTDVWVRIVQGNKTVFATGVNKPAIGKAGMTFTFPEPGMYDLSVRFENGAGSIVETKFPITVEPSEAAVAKEQERDKYKRYAIFGWSVAVVSIVVSGFSVLRKKR